MTDEATGKAVDAALVPIVASLGPWGVEEAHWLACLDEVVAGLDGPTAAGEPAERGAAGIVTMAAAAAGRDLDDTELGAVSVIATAAATVGITEGR